jgi:uncharacterized protein (TIRG00374 family)
MSRLRRIVLGFGVALLAVGGFLYAVGPAAVLAELSDADLVVLSVGFGSVVVALSCWSEAVRRLIASTGHETGGLRYRGAYLSGEFLKQVLPMGQSGGPVLMAYTVSREADTPYESALAAATTFAFLNVVASLVLAVAGLAFLVATRRGPAGPLLRSTLVAVSVMTALVLALAYLAVYRRSVLESVLLRATTAIQRSVGRVSARVYAGLSRDRVRTMLDAFGESVDRLTSDRRRVAAAVVLSVAGWFFFLLPLYTSFRAIGSPVPFALVVFVVPVVTLFNVVPLPGGLGGFEVALAAVTAALGAVDLPTATAAVFLFRLSNYWFLVLLGGVAATSLSVTVADPPPIVPVVDEAE